MKKIWGDPHLRYFDIDESVGDKKSRSTIVDLLNDNNIQEHLELCYVYTVLKRKVKKFIQLLDFFEAMGT